MSLCDEVNCKKRQSDTGCCGSSCASERSGCSITAMRIPSCNCQSNVGCLDRNDCGGLRPSGTAATGACPSPCHCVEEEIWNSNAPPKPNCEWLNNFTELRRQWSDHGRQQACKCCSCRSCRTGARCRSYFLPMPRCSSTTITPSDCQKYCGNRRLAGGASKSEMTSADKSSLPEQSLKRETGGGCPQSNCAYLSTHCNPNRNCSSTSSSDCPHFSQCNCFQYSPQQAQPNCQPCSLPLKSILKKRNCCQCTTSYCMCQPMPRTCNCPAPVQIDARAHRECTCDCPTSPECACPASERKFPRTMVKCPNARFCCHSPRLPSGPKCHCERHQPCLPPPCNPCTSTKCRHPVPPKDPCRPCPSCLPYRSVTPASTRASCRPSTPCRKLTLCSEPSNRPSSPCPGTDQFCCGITADKLSENNLTNAQNDIEEKHDTKDRDSSSNYYSCITNCVISANKSDDKTDDNTDDKTCYPTLNEGSVKETVSKASVNLLEDVNLSKSVDPDSTGMLEKIDEISLTNATGILERPTIEISLKDSRHSSTSHIQSDNREKFNGHTFREEHSHIGTNDPGNPVLAKLSDHLKSSPRISQKDLPLQNKSLYRKGVTFHEIPQPRVELLADVSVSTLISRRIDRRNETSRSSEKSVANSNNLSPGNCIIRWNISKLSFPVMHDNSVPVSPRQNRIAANLFRKLKASTSVVSRNS